MQHRLRGRRARCTVQDTTPAILWHACSSVGSVLQKSCALCSTLQFDQLDSSGSSAATFGAQSVSAPARDGVPPAMQPQPAPGLLRHVSLPAGACDGTNRSVKRKADWLDSVPGTPAANLDAGHGGTPQEWRTHGQRTAEGRVEELIGAHYGSGVRRPPPPQPPDVWYGTPLPAASMAMGPPCSDLQGYGTAAKQPCPPQTGHALLRAASAPPGIIPFASPPMPLVAHHAVGRTDAAVQQAPRPHWHSAQPWQQHQQGQPWTHGQHFQSAWHGTPPPTPQHPLPSPFPAWTHQPCWPQPYGAGAAQQAGWAPQRNLQRAFGDEITNRCVHTYS